MSKKLISQALIVSFLVVLGGCSKKVTKVEAPPVQAAPVVAEQPAPPPPPASVSPEESIESKLARLLNTIYFEYDSYSLRSDAVSILERIGPFLLSNSSIRIQTAGHCDERGSSEYNIGLGEKRANAVKNWLVSYGIPGSQIEITSYGKEQPVRSSCGAEDCHSLNRRVEWKVLSY